MIRKILTAVTVWLWMLPFVLNARAVSDTEMIYIQEDGIESIVQIAASMFLCIWKDIASVCAAAFCTMAMLILAVKCGKRNKKL